MSALSVDSRLREALDRGAPLAVALRFSVPPPTADLRRLGLIAEGEEFSGLLEPRLILALLAHPQVRSIRLFEGLEGGGTGTVSAQRPVVPRPALQRGPLSMDLERALREEPDRSHFSVIVSFASSPGDAPSEPGLLVSGDIGSGLLDREAVGRLSTDPRVQSIDLEPVFQAD